MCPTDALKCVGRATHHMVLETNTVKDRVENGDVAVGFKNRFHSKTLVEMGGNLGVDFVRLEYEPFGPAPSDTFLIEDYARVAEVSGTEIMIRFPPTVESHAIARAVNAGVRNFKITQVRTAEDVERVIAAAKYYYQGETGGRGVSKVRTNDFGHISDYEEFSKREDDNIFIGIVVENKEAIDNLDEILSVPELGHVAFGKSDLAYSLGHPGTSNNPDSVEAKKKFIRKVKEYDVPMYVDLHNDYEAEQAIEKGLGYGQDDIDIEFPEPSLLGVASTQDAIETTVMSRINALVENGRLDR